MVFGREMPRKMLIYKWYKLIRLTIFVKERAPADDQSLKLRCMKFK
jgi:hypothetical protein